MKVPQFLDTVCPLDCPDTCSLRVEVREGRVQALEAGPQNPYTRGYLCGKVSHYERYLYSTARLRQPAVRAGKKGEGRFQPLSWEEALQRLEESLRRVLGEWGGEAVLPVSYGGSNGVLSHDALDALFFQRLGASRLLRTVCAAPSGRAAAGLYGKMPGVALQDYVHARLIVLWGHNPSVTGIHLIPVLQEALRRGARLVIVDPRRINLAARAHLHLQVRPGTDLVVALALINWLFRTGKADAGFLSGYADQVEELARRASPWTLEKAAETAGVPLEDLEQLARWYGEIQPAVIRCGWGVERNRNGGSSVAAILALPAVAGKFGRRGGGYTMSQSGAWRLNRPQPSSQTRAINMNRLGRALLQESNPPIRFLFIYNCNPLATLPDQERVRRGLLREDLFTVVFDQVLTDTARYADLLLPATTFLEHDDLRLSYGNLGAQLGPRLVPAWGESRSNWEVFKELYLRFFGKENDLPSRQEWIRRLFSHHPELIPPLEGGELVRPPCGERPVQFRDVFPATPNGRVQLVPEALDREAPGGLYSFQPLEDEEYPLILISPARASTISSSLGNLDTSPALLEMHPQDAGSRGVVSGCSVRVFNQLGEVLCRARLNSALRPGVVSLPKGLWARQTLNGRTANALVPDTLTDLGGGACFNDARVQVEVLQL